MNVGTLRVRVARKIVEAEGISSFELVDADGAALPAFSAGAHVDVSLPGGLTRQYSLCNDPAESHRYLIAVLNEPASRGGSREMHERVQPGDVLQISAPRNHFPLARDAGHSLLLAGGIGITPILCMAERLAVLGSSFEMHYLVRSRARTAFFERIVRSAFAGSAHIHWDDGDAGQRLDVRALIAAQSPHTHLYVCGPGGFMDFVLDTARGLGWPEERLHYEFFAGKAVETGADSSFEVQLASTGRVVMVPADMTVVQALAAQGVTVPVSCGEGVCGTCLTRVLDGQPDHRDLYLTPEEQAANDQFLPCCSRACSARLVLDL